MSSTALPPTPTPPPAPDISDLYGDTGNLVSAPPTTPAGVNHGTSGSWGEGETPDESQRADLESSGALPKKRTTTTQTASPEIKKQGAAVQEAIDKPILHTEDVPELALPIEAGKATSAYLRAHGHEGIAKAIDAYTGIEEGGSDFVTAMSSPKNMVMMYSLGRLKQAGAAGAVVDRLINAKFSYDNIKNAYENIPGVKKAVDSGDYETAARGITSALASAATGVTAGESALEGTPVAEAGKNFVASAKEEIPQMINAKAPEGSTEAGKIRTQKRVAGSLAQNAAVGFIDPKGKFESFDSEDSTHEEAAARKGTTTDDMLDAGWVRKAGQGSYQTGALNPKTTAAIEKDILSDYSDLKNGNEYGQPVHSIVIDVNGQDHEIPVDDFIEKYNGDLDKALQPRRMSRQAGSIPLGGKPKIDLSSAGGTKVGDARRGSSTFGRSGGKFGEAVDAAFDTERKEAASVANNASGESAASQEAINRAASEKAKGESYARVDSRKPGSPIPLTNMEGPDAVPGPYDVIVKTNENGSQEKVKSGDQARPINLKTATAPIATSNSEPADEETEEPKRVDLGDLDATEAGETPDHLLTGERQSALQEPYQISVQNPDGTPRVEYVNAFSSKDALKQAQKQFPDAQEWSMISVPGERTPSTEYSVPKGKLLSMPEQGSGKSSEETMKHELGHALIGQNEGLMPDGILRHTHPDVSNNVRAAVRWSADQVMRAGRIIPTKLPSLIRMSMGGIAADEVFNNVPRAANHNFDLQRTGDGAQAYKFLRDAGYDHDGALQFMHNSIDAAKEHLSKPEISAIMNENAGVREKGLSKQYHMSGERLAQIDAEAKRRLGNGKVTDNGTTDVKGVGNGEANVAGGKGEVAPATGSVGAAEEVTSKYHPDLQAVADKFGTSTDASKVANGASFVAPDGKFIHLGNKEHDTALQSTFKDKVTERGYSGPLRHDFINDTGTIRTRFNPNDRAGRTLHMSVPEGGVTPEQIDSLKAAVREGVGRHGNLVMEVGDRGGKSTSKEFATANDIEPMLKEIGAHPDLHTKEINPEEEEDTSFNFGANEKSANADIPESKRTPTEQSTIDQLEKIANDHQKSEGREPVVEKKLQVDPRAEKMADAYAAAVHEPNSPKVKATYDALKKDINTQYDKLIKAGFKIDAQPHDPYEGDMLGVGGEQSGAEKAYNALRHDVVNNKHISVWQGGAPPADHPLSEVDPKTGLTYNEKFRAVHDVFGHVLPDNGFDAAGEESAWGTHNQMFSPAARPALATETRGQTAYVTKHGEFASQKATVLPEEFHHRPEDLGGVESHEDKSMPLWWNDQLHNEVYGGKTKGGQLIEDAAKNGGFTVHPRTGEVPKDGYNFEAFPERRVELGHPPTSEDLRTFVAKNRPLLNEHPDLYVGGYDNKSSGKYELNITGRAAKLEDATRTAKKLDQMSIWDNKNQKEIQTGGEGARTEFPNYSAAERANDLTGKPQSNIKDFEHLSKDFYDHMEPDEREYLKGNKMLQRNAMAQYHKIDPSVAETTNAMASGAALGGWWQRYMDVFHDLTGKESEAAASAMGPSHTEILKQWHAAVSGNKSVQDANNLAWHSYADWLDAGKPTDRTSINEIVKKNAAQPEGSEKKGNAAISDTLDKKGKIVSAGLDTSKLFALVNSPEMRGERPFSNEAFNEETPNALVAKTEGARKIPSMGATVAGKGNLNRLVIDAHIRDFYGRANSGGPAAQYIADSVHLRQAAEALGLKGGEGQEQLWGTVLGLKQILKEGLTPEQSAGKLNSDVINQIGKDYAEVIANDPEITKPGGLLDRLKEKYGVGTGSAGVGAANSKASASRAGQVVSRSSQTPIDLALLAKTAERIKGQISESKIKKPSAVPAEEASVPPKASPTPVVEDKYTAALKAGDAAAKAKREAAMKRGISGLNKPAK